MKAITYALLRLEPEAEIAVDSGHIEIGDCGQVQATLPTTYGDGVYPVYRVGSLLVIDMAPGQDDGK